MTLVLIRLKDCVFSAIFILPFKDDDTRRLLNAKLTTNITRKVSIPITQNLNYFTSWRLFSSNSSIRPYTNFRAFSIFAIFPTIFRNAQWLSPLGHMTIKVAQNANLILIYDPNSNLNNYTINLGIDYLPYSDAIGTSNFLENEGWFRSPSLFPSQFITIT